MSVVVTHTEFAALLRAAGLTQAAFARLSGVTSMAANNWCRGRSRVPQWAWVLASAAALVPADDLVIVPELAWHQTLGVSPFATPQQISAARNALAKKYHPDVNGSRAAMQRINAAFEAAKRKP